MPATTPAPNVSASEIEANLRRLGTLPAWLLAPLQAATVADALRQAVPELADGRLTLKSCKIKRMLLKENGRWVGSYALALDDSSAGKRSLTLRGTFTPPLLRAGEAPAVPEAPLGSPEWRCALPGLGLLLESEPAESELAAMPLLTDPEASRQMLEQGIAGSAPGYAELRLAACRPEVLSYKPGSRCTLRYHLGYPPELAERGWPTTVIAKTYRKDSKGRNAYEGMAALWATPLAASPTLALAEPLAYIPGVKVMVQGPVAGDQSLEELLKAALADDTPANAATLDTYMRKAAAGLAELHCSGVQHGETVGLGERYAELHKLVALLLAVAPELRGAAEPALARLEALAAATPADAPVPTHGTFNPEQVLIDGERVGIIDFDDMCMAEPAFDVGLFRAAIKDIGMNALDGEQARDLAVRQARLARLDAIGEVFLAHYESLAPISRTRVALWEAWSYLRDTLHFWIKAKPAEPDNGLLMLLGQLGQIGLLAQSPAQPRARQPRRQPATLSNRMVAFASALMAAGFLDEAADIIGDLMILL